MVKRIIIFPIMIALALAALFNAAAFAAAYPDKNINGIIMWGAGGVMDRVARSVAPTAEKELGKSIIMQNKTGASGAIATTYVKNAKPDGYNLLFGAENPNIYKVMGLSNIDYDDFEPIFIFMSTIATVCVNNDSPYKTYTDLINDAKKRKLRRGSTGPGVLPYLATSMIRSVHKGIDFNLVQFDGEGPALTALMGNHIDAFPVSMVSAMELIKGGKIRALAVFDVKRNPSLKEVPTVIEEFKEFKQYLPWGAFYGVFVRKDTPKDIQSTLRTAFKKAYDDPKFRDFANSMGGVLVGLTGEPAKKYIAHNKSVSAWLMQQAGAAKKSPAEFGIPKPK